MTHKKKIGMIIIVVITLVVLAAGYLTINYTNQDYILKKEIKSLSQLNIANDKFNTSLVSKGQYREVEKAIKNYLEEYAETLQSINKMVSDSQFNSLLSYDNLSKDVNFSNSIIYINTVSLEFNKDIDKLISMSKEKNIKDNIIKYNLEKHYVDLYEDLMINSEVSKKMKISIKNIENYRNRINTKINTCNDIFLFLNKNKDNYKFEENQLKFNSDLLINQYNEYVKKIRA